ncbi:hypothetical protein G4B88_021414 [Cannabis sativa]|uniref:Uncharacterized protein n=1 Tax=Cannabis sativa TaxID=3483 RepID=A0A7J6FI95_CANSA|nr:hypothetical protein G4B88_021414 [Cannabis sativa]
MATKMLMATTPLSLSSPPFTFYHHYKVFHCSLRQSSLVQRWSNGYSGMRRLKPFSFTSLMDFKMRRTLICAVNQDAEEAFKKTVEVDRLIDKLRDANPNELQQLVVENKDYEELAVSVMSIVDRLVHKTNEKIETSTDVLKDILKPVVEKVEGEEIPWPPRDPEVLKQMEKEVIEREKEGQLDEGFLAEVSAQLRQAKEDGDKPGLEAMLQKVLQLYASKVLSKRSYAKKGGEILKAEEFLETIIKAPEELWNKLLIDGMTVGKGEISPEELYAVIRKRIERTLIRTEGGSYQQRILTEYVKGIQSRAEEIVERTLICAVSQDADANPNEHRILTELAARTGPCKSEDDKKDYEELAVSVMSIIDRLSHKTNAKEDGDKFQKKKSANAMASHTPARATGQGTPEAGGSAHSGIHTVGN